MLIWLIACSTPPIEEPQPIEVPAPAPVTWHTERDAIALWSAEVPAEMEREQKQRSFEPSNEVSTLGAAKSKEAELASLPPPTKAEIAAQRERLHGLVVEKTRFMKPKERQDMLSSCVISAAKSWTFPETLSASNVEVPLSFF